MDLPWISQLSCALDSAVLSAESCRLTNLASAQELVAELTSLEAVASDWNEDSDTRAEFRAEAGSTPPFIQFSI